MPEPILPKDINNNPSASQGDRAAYLTDLIKKLGYSMGDTVMSIGEPDWFSTNLTIHGIINSRELPATWVHIFVDSDAEFEAIFHSLALEDIEKGIWISWPGKTSGAKTDITEDTLREVILPLGWVDTKVAAIDETWSGLKFLRRKS